MTHPYAILDVFTDTALAGNQLAIVMDADDLSTDTMQQLAREFNLAETVFVLGAKNKTSEARIRIFTPFYEMPFAGHPTVGTACYLANKDQQLVGQEFVLEENLGPVPCIVSDSEDGQLFARFSAPQIPESVTGPDARAVFAKALGLNEADIGLDGDPAHKPMRYSAGVSFTFVPVKNLEVLMRLNIDLKGWEQAFGKHTHNHAFVYCRETVDDRHHFHGRMFGVDDGVNEDPATGSAVTAFAGAVSDFENLTDGEHRFVIEQGYEMGRPSQIELTLMVENRALTQVQIGGCAVLFAEGVLQV